MYDIIKICCLLLNVVFVNFYFDHHFLSLNNTSVIIAYLKFLKKGYVRNLNTEFPSVKQPTNI